MHQLSHPARANPLFFYSLPPYVLAPPWNFPEHSPTASPTANCCNLLSCYSRNLPQHSCSLTLSDPDCFKGPNSGASWRELDTHTSQPRNLPPPHSHHPTAPPLLWVSDAGGLFSISMRQGLSIRTSHRDRGTENEHVSGTELWPGELKGIRTRAVFWFVPCDDLRLLVAFLHACL